MVESSRYADFICVYVLSVYISDVTEIVCVCVFVGG